MIKSAIARTPILIFIVTFFALGYTISHNKVVVVPLGSTDPTLDIYYASITADGVLESGNIESSFQDTNGEYRVSLGRLTTGCAGTVSRGSQGGGTAITSGESTVSVSIREITVRHVDLSQGTVSSDFHLTVICPIAGA